MLRRWAASMLALVYPPICLHCSEELETHSVRLCGKCLNELVLLDPAQHCPTCFQPVESITAPCIECRKGYRPIKNVAAAFSYEGPAATLMKKLKYGNQSHLAASLAAWMLVQWECLQWPKPDLIVPVPISWSRRWDRGYNQSYLIAEEFGKFVGSPVAECLKRRCDTYSQAGLTKQQRLEQSSNTYYFSQGTLLHDKTILLIDDVMTSGKTLSNCADALAEGYPEAIYALTFCKAE